MSEECTEVLHTRWSMKQEVKDTIDEEYLRDCDYPDDYMTEIADSLVPAYNHSLIEFCSHYSGEEFWDLWNDNQIGGETPIDILRGNLYCLYREVASEVLAELEEE